MIEELCSSCKYRVECNEPFPTFECDRYKRKYFSFEVSARFFGMSESMQDAIWQIMEETQCKERK